MSGIEGVTLVDYSRAAVALSEVGADMSRPFLDAIDVAGAALSTLGDPLGSQILHASDAIAARIEEIQIDFGEGPAWQSARIRMPVLLPDLDRADITAWPVAGAALQECGAIGLFSFPMFVGAITVGIVDLYRPANNPLAPASITAAETLAHIASRQVLKRALIAASSDRDDLPPDPHSRRDVHQATGMVAAQMRISVDDALWVIRGHAFAEERPVIEVSRDVIGRRLTFAL